MPEDDAFLFAMSVKIPERLALPSVTPTCGCPYVFPAGPPIAYVFPTQPYTVHTCPLFWTAKLLPRWQGDDSRAGSLIHEVSHFRVDGLLYTRDHAAGRTAAHSILPVFRNLAIRNAYNWQFFSMEQ